ncbi:PAH-inducible cytochrome P450 monooxygenase PC-PAH 4 [Trametes polyzona]|nr:PAH-inducible cytochrome P450 monooxygenase PC-PAH 4 [Trametes polyzona]
MISASATAYVTITLIFVLFRASRRGKSIRHLRGPARFPSLLGHDFQLNLEEDVGDLEFEWYAEYGPTWRIQGSFGADYLMTADPRALSHIYNNNYLKKTSQNHVAYIISGPGIVWAQGERHLRQRKIMNPAFTASHIRSFLPLFRRITAKLVEKWRAELSTTPEAHVQVNNWISRATLDIIGRAAFDFDYGSLDELNATSLAKAYHGVFKDAEFRTGAASMLFRETWDYIPDSILKLLQYLPVDPFKRLLSLRRLYAEYGQRILQEKLPEVNADDQTRSKDFMSILIKANASSDAKGRLDDEELMAEMFTLTLAGHETSAGTFSFLLYELARHPEYQSRMRQEIREARARLRERGGADFTTEDLDKMPLCLNAIKETLRYHPIVSNLPRVATKDDVIPLSYPIVAETGEKVTEIPISKGQVIITSIAVYNRLTEVWGEDASVWNPDRFTRPEIANQLTIGPFANVMTFTAGLRGCVGWRFAVIEMQALLAGLVESFEFKLPEGADPSDDPKRSEVQRVPSGPSMLPLLRGKPELGPYLRLRISPAEPA